VLTDDAIGLRVAEAARDRLAGNTSITVDQSAEMGLSLLDLVVGFDSLVLIDAIETLKAPAGSVHEISGEDLNVAPTISPHFLGVGEVLALGRALGFAMPHRVRIFAIEVLDTVTVGTELTPPLQAAFPGIVARIVAAIEEGIADAQDMSARRE
jgi:hydrogenase maturation protease